MTSNCRLVKAQKTDRFFWLSGKDRSHRKQERQQPQQQQSSGTSGGTEDKNEKNEVTIWRTVRKILEESPAQLFCELHEGRKERSTRGPEGVEEDETEVPCEAGTQGLKGAGPAGGKDGSEAGSQGSKGAAAIGGKAAAAGRPGRRMSAIEDAMLGARSPAARLLGRIPHEVRRDAEAFA